MPRKECVLPIESNRPNGPLDAVVVDLDAAVGQEELKTIPVFDDGSTSFESPSQKLGLRSRKLAVREHATQEGSICSGIVWRHVSGRAASADPRRGVRFGPFAQMISASRPLFGH